MKEIFISDPKPEDKPKLSEAEWQTLIDSAPFGSQRAIISHEGEEDKIIPFFDKEFYAISQAEAVLRHVIKGFPKNTERLKKCLSLFPTPEQLEDRKETLENIRLATTRLHELSLRSLPLTSLLEFVPTWSYGPLLEIGGTLELRIARYLPRTLFHINSQERIQRQ